MTFKTTKKWETHADRKKKADLQKLIPIKGVDIERHARCCKICNHERREEINEAYLSWERVIDIAREFGILERLIYRHVKATGMDLEKLKNRKRFYLKIMESAQLGETSASEAVAAGKLIEQLEGRISSEPMSLEEREKRYQEIEDKINKVEHLPAVSGKQPA